MANKFPKSTATWNISKRTQTISDGVGEDWVRQEPQWLTMTEEQFRNLVDWNVKNSQFNKPHSGGVRVVE